MASHIPYPPMHTALPQGHSRSKQTRTVSLSTWITCWADPGSPSAGRERRHSLAESPAPLWPREGEGLGHKHMSFSQQPGRARMPSLTAQLGSRSSERQSDASAGSQGVGVSPGGLGEGWGSGVRRTRFVTQLLCDRESEPPLPHPLQARRCRPCRAIVRKEILWLNLWFGAWDPAGP